MYTFVRVNLIVGDINTTANDWKSISVDPQTGTVKNEHGNVIGNVRDFLNASGASQVPSDLSNELEIPEDKADPEAPNVHDEPQIPLTAENTVPEESGSTNNLADSGGEENRNTTRIVTLKVEATATGVTLHISVPQRL